MPARRAFYLAHSHAKDVPAGQGPAIPSDRSPSRRQRARLSVVYWSPGPCPGLDPLAQQLSPCWTPQQLTVNRRDVNRLCSAMSRAAGRPWFLVFRSGTIEPLPAV